MKFCKISSEDSGDGLGEFFSTLEPQIHTYRIIFPVDMKMSAAVRYWIGGRIAP
jgi:hypothetical protein